MDSPAWGRVDISWCECVVAIQVSVLSSCTIFECRQLVSNWSATKKLYTKKINNYDNTTNNVPIEAVDAGPDFIFIHELGRPACAVVLVLFFVFVFCLFFVFCVCSFFFSFTSEYFYSTQ